MIRWLKGGRLADAKRSRSLIVLYKRRLTWIIYRWLIGTIARQERGEKV